MKSLLSFFFAPHIKKQINYLSRIPFVINSIDNIFLGITKGSITEICGDTESGRTSLALQIAESFQKFDGFVAIIDSHNYQI